MYQPRRAARALDAARPAPAFQTAPRRSVRRRGSVLLSRIAPAVVSLSVLAGVGGVALNASADPATLAVPAPGRDTGPSRSEARTALDAPATELAAADTGVVVDDEPMDDDGADDVVDDVPSPSPEPTSEPTPDEAFVGGSWSDAFGTVIGEQFAQQDLQVRAQVGTEAAVVGKLAQGDKISVTDKVVDGWTQVALDGKVGWVRSDHLGSKAPAMGAAAQAGPAASGSEGGGRAAARTGGKLQWPTAGSIGSKWGMRKHPILGYTRLHGGVDIGGPVGQPIYAAEDGVVTKAARGHNSGSGNNVRIDHGTLSGKGVETAYLHMHKINVKVGQKVKRGQVIGTLGNTGLSTGPHLHFSVYLNGANSNPAPWLG